LLTAFTFTTRRSSLSMRGANFQNKAAGSFMFIVPGIRTDNASAICCEMRS
jgi:hypothetical protein